jgi:hypothetical protein
MTINPHIAKRFLLHYFMGIPIWIGVFYGLSFVSQEPKPLAVALMMLVIAVREIFDANQLAKIRGELLKRVRGINFQRFSFAEIDATLRDPRYTLKKSMYDLASWSLSITTALWIL